MTRAEGTKTRFRPGPWEPPRNWDGSVSAGWRQGRAAGAREALPRIKARGTAALDGRCGGAIGDRGRLAAPRHCHVALNVRGGTFTPEWQCAVHCHSVSIVPQRYAQGRVAVRSVRSGPSGSAAHTATRWRTCGAVRLTLPLGGERAGRYVHARVAVRVGPARQERRGVSSRAGGLLGRSSWLVPYPT